MISHRGQTQAAFQIKVFALCGSVCLRYFFPSRRLNFPHQMEKISIGKEQFHRWWYAQARMQTYAVHGGKKSTNEKSVLLSHKHVTIFISLLGVFSLSSSQFRQNTCMFVLKFVLPFTIVITLFSCARSLSLHQSASTTAWRDVTCISLEYHRMVTKWATQFPYASVAWLCESFRFDFFSWNKNKKWVTEYLLCLLLFLFSWFVCVFSVFHVRS